MISELDTDLALGWYEAHCKHIARFRGVFDLPHEDRGCLACALERTTRQRDELAAALREMGDWLAYGLDKPDGAEPTAADYKRAQEVAANGRAALSKVQP
jgi:hypothetical protein